MALTVDDQIAAYEDMLASAYEALKQLNKGAQTNVNFGNKSYSFADRGALMDNAARLERTINKLKSSKKHPFGVYRIVNR